MKPPKKFSADAIEEIIKEIMKHSFDNPISMQDVATKFNLTDTRDVRKIISFARTTLKAHIGNGKGGKGYCKSNDWEEYKDTFERQIKQAFSIIKAQNSIRKDFAISRNLSLFDQSIFNSRYEHIIKAIEELQG